MTTRQRNRLIRYGQLAIMLLVLGVWGGIMWRGIPEDRLRTVALFGFPLLFGLYVLVGMIMEEPRERREDRLETYLRDRGVPVIEEQPEPIIQLHTHWREWLYAAIFFLAIIAFLILFSRD